MLETSVCGNQEWRINEKKMLLAIWKYIMKVIPDSLGNQPHTISFDSKPVGTYFKDLQFPLSR